MSSSPARSSNVSVRISGRPVRVEPKVKLRIQRDPPPEAVMFTCETRATRRNSSIITFTVDHTYGGNRFVFFLKLRPNCSRTKQITANTSSNIDRKNDGKVLQIRVNDIPGVTTIPNYNRVACIGYNEFRS